MTEYSFNLTPLTPLHIGSGESLEPFEYVVAGNTLYRFMLDDFMVGLPRAEQARFVELVGRSVPATQRFVVEHGEVAVQAARYTMQMSRDAVALYDGRLNNEAHPEVATTIRSSERPYIPSSSLKGALRTALLYHSMDKPNAARGDRDARPLEQQTFKFRTVQEDPFRAFKVGDGQLLDAPTRVCAVRVHTLRAGRWEEDVPLLVETVPGALYNNVEETTHHTVTFDTDFDRYHPDAFRLEPALILAACREFYGAHLTAEREHLRDLAPAAAVYDALTAQSAQLPPHACLVRLGWGSGFDATTVAYGLQDAKDPHSRRLTEEKIPLGWAELAVFDAAGQPLAAPTATLPSAPVTRHTSPPTKAQSLHNLTVGMEIEGTVTRIASYGAFVDVGVGRDGLIHISQLADRYVRQVEDVVQVGARVRVRVLDVDLQRRRIGLKLLEVLR